MARDKRKEGAAEPVKALSGLYPARSLVDEREAHSVDLPASAASYFVGAGSRSGVLSPVDPFACGNARRPGLPVSCPWNGLPDMHRWSPWPGIPRLTLRSRCISGTLLV